MIPPLADFVNIPTGITLVSGKDARTHLNRMLTVDVSRDSLLDLDPGFPGFCYTPWFIRGLVVQIVVPCTCVHALHARYAQNDDSDDFKIYNT